MRPINTGDPIHLLRLGERGSIVWLGHRLPRSVRGIGFVHLLAGVLAAAFCANEYLDFDIKGRIV
jgi:hypothetical protein